MEPTFWVSLTLFIIVMGAVIYGIIKLSKGPGNAGQEPGRILLRLGVTYTLSFLILIQIFLNVVEAAIVGSLQDPGVNTGARMSGHFLIAAVGILGALTWIKSFREMISSIMLKEKDAKGVEVYAPFWSKRFPLFMITFVLMLLGLIASLVAPVANMWTLANAVHNTRELEIFFAFAKYSMGWKSQIDYAMVLAEAGAPARYSPWGGLAGVMVFSIVITATHIMIYVWEVVFALKLSMTKSDMTAAFETDLYSDKKPSKDKGGKGKGGKDDKDKDDEGDDEGDGEDDSAESGKDKKKKKSQHSILEKLWEFMGMDGDAAEKWSEKVYPLLNKSGSDKESANVEFASSISDIHRKIMHFESKGHGPKKESAADLEKELRDLIFKRSNRKLTLPGRKNG